jgi:hypothetical protein
MVTRSEDALSSAPSELALFDLSGWLLASGSIAGVAAGGHLRAEVPDDKRAGLPVGRQVRFQCALAQGEVQGLAEIVELDGGAALGLRLLQIDNADGLPRLLDAMHGWMTRSASTR